MPRGEHVRFESSKSFDAYPNDKTTDERSQILSRSNQREVPLLACRQFMKRSKEYRNPNNNDEGLGDGYPPAQD